MDKKLVIDSNILIYCHRQIYPFEIAPSFWRQLIEKGSEKIVILDKVKEEICRNEDQLSEWLGENENTQYKESAKNEFASIADSWICAYGMAYDEILVTNEKYEPDIKKRIKIPNVCKEFDIEYIGLLEFMKKLGIKFE